MGRTVLENRFDYNTLLEDCRKGDSSARERLFGGLRVRLGLILKYRLRGWPAEDLDDILQETLMVVAEKLEHIESTPDLFALDVLRKKIGNRLASRQRKSVVSLAPSDGETESEAEVAYRHANQTSDEEFALVESADIAEMIRRAIRRLSPLCQMLFAALLENLSVARTWELMHAAQGSLHRSTFDKRLFDCRKRLRQLLAHEL